MCVCACVYHCAKLDFNNLKVLEMGPLRFRKGELKVTITSPLKLKGCLYERGPLKL